MRSLLPLSLCFIAISALAQEPPNLVKNPSMETITADGFAADWRGGEFGKPGKNVITDTTYAHTGEYSIRVATSPGSFVTCAGADIPGVCDDEGRLFMGKLTGNLLLNRPGLDCRA